MCPVDNWHYLIRVNLKAVSRLLIPPDKTTSVGDTVGQLVGIWGGLHRELVGYCR